jgi:hypothetical protein
MWLGVFREHHEKPVSFSLVLPAMLFRRGEDVGFGWDRKRMRSSACTDGCAGAAQVCCAGRPGSIW